jgi:exodeoxyribonuclease VII small subunit
MLWLLQNQAFPLFYPMARPRTAGSPEPEVTFEQAMSELEEIVHVLEDSRLPLDELVEKYERGAGLLRICQNRLNSAQQRIESITRTSTGSVRLEPFTENAPGPPGPAPASKGSRKPSSPDHVNIDEIRLF